MNRIRVLRVVARMNVGGPAVQVVGLMRHLDETRYDHRLLTGDVGDGEEDLLQLRASDIAHVRVRGLGRDPDPAGDLRALRQLVREIRDFRPHIIHTHTAKAGTLGRLAAFISRSPVRVHTFHGHLLTGYFGPATTRAVVGVERLLAKRTTRLLSVGQQVRDELLAAGIGRAEQYRVVPPGIDRPIEQPRAEARASFGVPSGARIIAFVGRLVGVKRPDRFMEVAHALSRLHDDLYFLVAGEGDRLAATRTAAVALGDRCRFLGWTSDVGAIYSAADAVLLTSDNEGMPVALIEAAMLGCPSVATRVGSVDEVVLDGQTGLLCRPDVGEIAVATSRLLLDESLRRKLGSAAATFANASFGVERLANDTAAIYEELVG